MNRISVATFRYQPVHTFVAQEQVPSPCSEITDKVFLPCRTSLRRSAPAGMQFRGRLRGGHKKCLGITTSNDNAAVQNHLNGSTLLQSLTTTCYCDDTQIPQNSAQDKVSMLRLHQSGRHNDRPHPIIALRLPQLLHLLHELRPVILLTTPNPLPELDNRLTDRDLDIEFLQLSVRIRGRQATGDCVEKERGSWTSCEADERQGRDGDVDTRDAGRFVDLGGPVWRC